MSLDFLHSEPIVLSDAELARFERHGCDAVRGSAAISLAHFRQDVAVDNKAASGFDPVTEADRACEAFIREQLLWGTLAGLSDGRAPVLGILYQPYTDELFVGSRLGARVERGGETTPLRTSSITELSTARLFCTSFEIFTPAERSHAYAMLAAGHADLVVEAGLQCYDIYALIPIIEAAGGVVSNWSGGDASLGGTLVAAATPELHAQALDLLRGEAP